MTTTETIDKAIALLRLLNGEVFVDGARTSITSATVDGSVVWTCVIHAQKRNAEYVRASGRTAEQATESVLAQVVASAKNRVDEYVTQAEQRTKDAAGLDATIAEILSQ